MNTHTIKTFVLFAMLVSAFSCKKDLKEVPKTFISPSAYFTNPKSFDQAVIGIYSGLSGLENSNTNMLLEMCTDIYGTPSPLFEQALPTYQNAPAYFYYNTRLAWSGAYTIIKNANFVIANLPSSLLSSTQNNALLAEAKFLRAYAFFYLVQLYGDVPLPLKLPSNYIDLKMPRTPQAEVYKQILDDLTYAEANLPDVAIQQGRVYKLVATALLAKVYLTMAGNPLKQTQYYSNARDKALAVINSGKFALLNDYSTIFHNTAYTSESIWEQLFVPTTGGNPMYAICVTANSFKPILLPSTWFINSFSKGDQRKEWGIQLAYKDPSNNTLAPFFQKFVNNAYIDAGYTSYSGALIINYTMPILRLAEMYLIAAEAENELNGPTNAYQYINKIRWRARVNKSDPTNVPDLAGLSQSDFRLAVWMERKWELCLEGSSWFDMKRSNTFSNIQTLRGSGLINPIGPYNQTWLIPDNEIINNNIPQNPAY
ncbi:MAG: RagB/SusD family nutrient uptake outer membrane protein [Bacteroidetes bacterium]|nr:RagB/SusD family nutrient uptake outer membrane protein [Bacteroidota bacterium]MBS1609037.1 RagB/SusD family nutrient uptake outer membrane protein [Bacteroidota bacterium]